MPTPSFPLDFEVSGFLFARGGLFVEAVHHAENNVPNVLSHSCLPFILRGSADACVACFL
jgi:hypothetical protein